MKLHEMKSKIEAVTGLPVFDVNDEKGHYLEVTVLGDKPEMIAPTEKALTEVGVLYSKKPKGRKFAGQGYRIPIRNVGTPFNASWEFGR